MKEFDKTIKNLFEFVSASKDATLDVFQGIKTKRNYSPKKLQEIFQNTLSAESVFNIQLNEKQSSGAITFKVSEPSDPNIPLLEFFRESLSTTYRAFTLTPYSIEELKTFRVFVAVVDGQVKEAGFALKPHNGSALNEIVAVHKNPKAGDIGKVAEVFMKASKQYGGKFLDHFDGPLSGIYDLHGFGVYDLYEWEDQYMPKGWIKSEEALDISKKTVYAPFANVEGEDVNIDDFSYENFSYERKKRQYASGAIDVIARKI